jgi:hypothetical protein
MSDQLLEIDIRLLVLRYGRQRVIRALAGVGEQRPEELEQQLRATEQKRKSSRPRLKPSLVDLAAAETAQRPDISEPLRALAIGFETRTFLPELRDAQRFLDRANASQRKLKSRADAGPALIRTLARLRREDLLRLAAKDESAGESDFSLLARAIMGPSGIEQRNSNQPRIRPLKS